MLFVLCWLIGFAVFSFQSLSRKSVDNIHTSDAIIVLTGGLNRIDEALGLFAQGKANTLFISGVHPDVQNSDIFERWHGDTALPPCCLVLGKKSTTTVENAKESQEWVRNNDIASIILVTSNYHMPRATLEFKAALPDVEITAYPIQQDNLDVGERRIWELLFEEYHKVMWRGLQLLFSFQ